MVADLRAVADLNGVGFFGNTHVVNTSGDGGKRRNGGFHIVRQKPAVRAGIGAELLFIERLQIIKRLLGRIAEQTVRVALKCGQVVERGRLLEFFFLLYLSNNSRFPFAGGGNGLGLRLRVQLVAGGGQG